MEIVRFDYINHKGVRKERTVLPISLDFMFNPNYGYQPGWFLTGIDQDKNAVRSFALYNIIAKGDVDLKTIYRLQFMLMPKTIGGDESDELSNK